MGMSTPLLYCHNIASALLHYHYYYHGAATTINVLILWKHHNYGTAAPSAMRLHPPLLWYQCPWCCCRHYIAVVCTQPAPLLSFLLMPLLLLWCFFFHSNVCLFMSWASDLSLFLCRIFMQNFCTIVLYKHFLQIYCTAQPAYWIKH